MEIHMQERAPIKETFILETDWCRAPQSQSQLCRAGGPHQIHRMCVQAMPKSPVNPCSPSLSDSRESALPVMELVPSPTHV